MLPQAPASRHGSLAAAHSEDSLKDLDERLRQFDGPARPRVSLPSSRILTALLAGVTAGIVIVAGGLSVGHVVSSHEPPGRAWPVVPDGPTFYQALSAVNASTTHLSGGPWLLFSVYGIAAPVPFSPELIGESLSENETVNFCGHEFNGVTLFNGTLPTFDGTFNSGTAPFWEFAFYSNQSQQVLVTTDIQGTVDSYSPISVSNECHPWVDFIANNSANWTRLQTHLPVNSSVAAAAVWGTTAQESESVAQFVGQGEPYAEIMTIGPGFFQGFGDQDTYGWGVIFDRCGEVDITGVQPFVAAGVANRGEGPVAGIIYHNCALQYSGAGVFDTEYDWLFSSPSIESTAGSTQVAIPYQLGAAYPNGTFGDFYDEVGLANWMTKLTLTSPSGPALSLASPTCLQWVPSLGDCPAAPSGWFAVLTSPYGEWIDSYGVQPNGSAGWSMAVTAFVSNQELVIVIPSSWDPIGDVLTPTCTNTFSVVEGSATL
jgi:hypothetical protein